MANQGPLQRHFSDNLGFAPRHPSRLGPGGNSSLPRGTVSLPTSPLLSSSRHNESVWPNPPQSAQAFFNLPDPDPAFDTAPWYSITYPSSSETVPLSLDDPFAPLPAAEPIFDDSPAQVAPSSGPAGGAAQMRKKRAQVRIACTHCQKACKKCSNTRPCDRCVKYGLKDCVDSTRKPRKTGVKRGPYKRRSSGKYSSGYDPSSSPPPSQDSPTCSYAPSQSYTHQYADLTHADHFQTISPGIHSGGYTSPPQALSQSLVPLPQHQQQRQHQHHQYHSGVLAHDTPRPHDPHVPMQGSMGIPPGPRTAALHGAFAQALSGPRWVHGQRTGRGLPDEVMYPPTPVVPFPISLNHRDDPFSRAVSPIHGELDTALQGLKPTTDRLSLTFGQTGQGQGQVTAQSVVQPVLPVQGQVPAQGHYGYTGQRQDDFSRPNDVFSGNDSQNPPIEFTNPFESFQMSGSGAGLPSSMHAVSAPTSPRMTTEWSTSRFTRSSSAELPITSDAQFSHTFAHEATFHTSQSSGLIALTKIRKPSLRTLMSHGGSLAPSRQVSPVVEESPSPTLFDQPMELDEAGMDVKLSGWGGLEQGGKGADVSSLASPLDVAFDA